MRHCPTAEEIEFRPSNLSDVTLGTLQNKMTKQLEVTFAPAEFEALSSRDLNQTACVVFDVLRATTSMIAALQAGAQAIRPVSDITEALLAHQEDPQTLLAGERNGLRIRAELTGGTDFHLGNSPREFTSDKVRGKTIIMTTTNGTCALRAVAHASTVLVGSFLNLTATAAYVRQNQFPGLLVVCGGTFEQMAYEDVLAAGALCDLLWPDYSTGQVADSALIARTLFHRVAGDVTSAFSRSRNGRRLLEQPELREDVVFSAQRDTNEVVALLRPNGLITASPEIGP